MLACARGGAGLEAAMRYYQADDWTVHRAKPWRDYLFSLRLASVLDFIDCGQKFLEFTRLHPLFVFLRLSDDA